MVSTQFIWKSHPAPSKSLPPESPPDRQVQSSGSSPQTASFCERIRKPAGHGSEDLGQFHSSFLPLRKKLTIPVNLFGCHFTMVLFILQPEKSLSQYSLKRETIFRPILYIGPSSCLRAFFSSFRISICCGQCCSHFPHSTQLAAAVEVLRRAVHMKCSISAANFPSE